MSEKNRKNELTAKQQKQLLKQQRRFKYTDLAIQNTNNSSITSKRSVEILYYPKMGTNKSISDPTKTKQYIGHFVKGKIPRRSPCINRGYWLRLEAIRSRLLDIIESSNNDTTIMVINLGCGFDPLPFELLDFEDNADCKGRFYNSEINSNIVLKFLDVDYPDLVAEKLQLINSDSELLNILAQGDNKNRYDIVSCDLNNIDSFETKVLKNIMKQDPGNTFIKVYIAEVSLAYMKPELADQVISKCSTLPNSHFILLEQLAPMGVDEPFAKQMLKHFKKNDSPLQSVLKYQDMKSQVNRFTDLGWPKVNCGDMYDLWESLPADMKNKVSQVEPFDELEEFLLFAHSYILLHATNVCDNNNNNNTVVFHKPLRYTKGISDPNISFYDQQCLLNADTKFNFSFTESGIQKKCGACSSDGLYFGGIFNGRSNDIVTFDKNETVKQETTNRPTPRVFHSFTQISKNRYILIGGRMAPNKVLKDCWEFTNSDNGTWKRLLDLPFELYRHSTIKLDNELLLIIGSKVPLLYNFNSNSYDEVRISDEDKRKICYLESAAVAYKNGYGVVIGGMSKQQATDIKIEFNPDLYVFKLLKDVDGRYSLEIVNSLKSDLFKRYGARCCFIGHEDKPSVLLIGGVSDKYVLGRETTIIQIKNILPKGQEMTTIELVPIPIDIWNIDSPFVYVDFELVMLPKPDANSRYYSIVLCGGGAVCYGFGSVWNTKNLIITTE